MRSVIAISGSGSRSIAFCALAIGYLLSPYNAHSFQWMDIRGDGGRSGHNPAEVALRPPLEIGPVTATEPEADFNHHPRGLLVDGARFYTHTMQEIFAYDMSTRALQWHLNTHEGSGVPTTFISREPVLSGGWLIYGQAGMGGAYLIALDPATGQQAWSEEFNMMGFIADDAHIYGVISEFNESTFDEDLFLVQLRSQDGAELWRHEIDGIASQWKFVTSGGYVLWTLDEEIIAHRTSDGGEVWRYAIPGFVETVNSDMIATEETVVYAFEDRVLALDLATGAPLWDTVVGTADACKDSAPHLVSDGQTLVVAGACPVMFPWQGRTVAFDLATGAEKWSRTESLIPLANTFLFPVTANGVVYTIGYSAITFYSEPTVMAYSIESGELLDVATWQRDFFPLFLAVHGGSLLLSGLLDEEPRIVPAVAVMEQPPADIALFLSYYPACDGVLGGNLHYRLRVYNDGPGVASGMQVEVRVSGVDAAVSMQSAVGAANGGAIVSVPVEALQEGEFATVDVEVLPADTGTVIFAANASGPAEDPDPGRATVVHHVDVVEGAIAPIDLIVTGIEVNQGLQNLAHDIELIAGRRTLVRVSLSEAGNSAVGNVKGAVLHGERGGVPLSGSPLTPLFGPQCIDVPEGGSARSELDETANFVLPYSWRRGTVTLRAEANAFGEMPETNHNNNTLERTVTFVEYPPVCFVSYTVRTADSSGTDLFPDPEFDESIRGRALSLLPTPDLWVYPNDSVIQKWLGPISRGPYDMNSGADSGHILHKLWWRTTLSTRPRDCRREGARTLRLGVVDPATNATFNGVALLSFSQQITNMRLTDAGNQPFNNPHGGRTLAHEAGHNFGRKHVDCRDPDDPDENYPHDGCEFAPVDEAGFYGLDLMDLTNINLIEPVSSSVSVSDQVGDLMSYASNRWTSDYTWNAIASRVTKDVKSLAMARGPAMQKLLETDEVLLLTGFVEGGEAEFLDLSRLPQEILDEEVMMELWLKHLDARDEGSDHQVVLLDSTGGVIATYPVEPVPLEDIATDILFLAASVPFVSGTAGVEVRQNGTPMAEAPVSPNPPQVSIVTPTGGETVDDLLLVTWDASDPDGDDLTYSVLYSDDLGETWNAIATGILDMELEVDATRLPGSDAGSLIRVIANDGVNTAIATSEPFSVAMRPPSVSIHSPRAGQTFEPGQGIFIEGRALDPEEGLLRGGALRWLLNGREVATGHEAYLDTLPAGTYSLTLEASDQGERTSSATVEFHVNALPALDPSVLPAVMDVLLGWTFATGVHDLNVDGTVDAADVVHELE